MELEKKVIELQNRVIELQKKILELEKRTQILEEKISKKVSLEKEGWYDYDVNNPNSIFKNKSYLFHVNDEGKVDKMFITEFYEKRWVENGQHYGRSGYTHKGYCLILNTIGKIHENFYSEYMKNAQKIDTLTKEMLEFRALCNDL